MDVRIPIRWATWLLVLSLPLSAQGGKWNLDIQKIPVGQRIVVDGDLNEVAWESAVTMDPLTQVDPVEGARPTHPTKVRICYDRDHLYVGVQCQDDPELVRGRMMRRDARLDPDDRVEFWFDTFHDRRFGYWFQIGAGGSKGDALLGGGNFNKSWDGIWHGRSKTTSTGWQAEVAIPFKTLAFKVGARSWGFNLRRRRAVNDEEDRWAMPLVAYQFFSLTQGGTLSGFEGIRQGVGLDVVPFLKTSASRDRSAGKHTSVLAETGLDASYRLSPSMNLRVTYNTDFAETEVDERQTNLTRFPLFFPEKRDFFLEDAGMFEFGIPSRRGRSREVIPFFSRRIGRDGEGESIPIIVGGKLTGRTDDWNFGVLEVYQDEHTDSKGQASDDRALSVMRVTRNVGKESSVGMIATVGSPTAADESVTTGVDFHVGDSAAFGPGSGYDIYGWWLGSYTDGAGGDDNAYGMRFQYRSREWRMSFTETHVEEDFNPALGFVRRQGIRQHRLAALYTWRPRNSKWLRRYESRVTPVLTTTEQGSKDSWSVPWELAELTFASHDTLSYEIERSHERLHQDFEIRDGVILRPGDYSTTNHVFSFETNKSRWAYLAVKARFGGFYTGNLTSVEVEPTFILGPHLSVSSGYEENHVNLNEGKFTTRLMSGRVDVAASPDLIWRNLVQYDGDTKSLSAQSRVRWIYKPGQEMFLVGLYGWDRADHQAPLVPTTQELALKVQYTIRF